MNPALKALLYPYEKGLLNPPTPGSQLLFMNAEMTPALKDLAVNPILLQPRYDRARTYMNAGYKVNPEWIPEKADTAWLLPGKDAQEAQYLIAVALRVLKPGATLVAAAANDAGGKRLGDFLEDAGLTPQEESKYKARVVFATVDSYRSAVADAWFAQGSEQPILDGSLLSRPGLHSWDKIDAGSALLAGKLPSLQGRIADFGCGWGYLSLQATGNITHLTLIDNDVRALGIAVHNLSKKKPSLPTDALWLDLTHPERRLGPFDAILLNPPFHDGTQAAPALGQTIIATAAQALKPSGVLYLVANRHLPYERTLQALFKKVELLADEGGFKAFACGLS